MKDSTRSPAARATCGPVSTTIMRRPYADRPSSVRRISSERSREIRTSLQRPEPGWVGPLAASPGGKLPKQLGGIGHCLLIKLIDQMMKLLARHSHTCNCTAARPPATSAPDQPPSACCGQVEDEPVEKTRVAGIPAARLSNFRDEKEPGLLACVRPAVRSPT